MTRIVQCLSHSIESFDQLRLYTELGYEAVDIGGYIDPQHPHDPKRPPVPGAKVVPEIKEAVDGLGTSDNLGEAQQNIPDAVLDWLGNDGVLIYHHYLERLVGQWPRIRDWMQGSGGRRVVWRTVGQSVEGNERFMAPLRADGLEIVRYSPKERNIPGFAGEDALIRFYKDPDEWQGWTGDWLVGHNDLGPVIGDHDDMERHSLRDAKPFVLNVTQHLRQREPYTNWGFWEAATAGLTRVAAGPGSEEIGGPGETSFEVMKKLLRGARAYLYTGTQPASYTLGLIEAMMTGIPVVSIGPSWMRIFEYGPDLFEGHEIVETLSPNGVRMLANPEWSDDPAVARRTLEALLSDAEIARVHSNHARAWALHYFGKETIAAQWREFLGAPTVGGDPYPRRAVGVYA